MYSLHEPEVLCSSKGKEHKKYEFANKVSIVKTQNTGVIVGAMGFRNEYDGHTLPPALEQVARLVGKEPNKWKASFLRLIQKWILQLKTGISNWTIRAEMAFKARLTIVDVVAVLE